MKLYSVETNSYLEIISYKLFSVPNIHYDAYNHIKEYGFFHRYKDNFFIDITFEFDIGFYVVVAIKDNLIKVLRNDKIDSLI